MSNFKERFKKRGYNWTDCDFNRSVRSSLKKQDRRDAREKIFNAKRNLEIVFQNDSLDKKKNESKKLAEYKKRMKLQKWKAERDKNKLLENKNKKPVFKVYSTRSRVHSPPLYKEIVPLPPLKISKNNNFSKSAPVSNKTTEIIPTRIPLKTITNQKKAISSNKVEPKNEVKNIFQNKPFAPANYQFNAPKGLNVQPKLENRTETTPITDYLQTLFQRLQL